MRKIKNPFKEIEGYNCFGCCSTNPLGLKLEFYEEGDEVVSTWQPQPDYQGWFHVLHGGIAATLLDELSGWTIQRKLQVTGMTTSFNLRYKAAVSISKPIILRAHIGSVRHQIVTVEAQLEQEGEVCVTAQCTYFTFSKEKCKKDWFFEGCELEEE